MSKIMVFGSAHLDVCAFPSEQSDNHVDRPGRVRFFVGGSGFNISKNLVTCGRAVSLFTHLPSKSVLSSIIQQEIAKSGIGCEFVLFDESLDESAFVAIFEKNKLCMAITSAGIENAIFDIGTVEAAVRDAVCIVIDCNLSVEMIAMVVSFCWKYQKTIVVSPASAEKLVRYRGVTVPVTKAFFLVGMNLIEAEHAYGSLPVDVTCWDASSLLEFFKCRNLIISMGPEGHLSVDSEGVRKFGAPPIDQESWPFGAGDALLASHCACIDPSKSIDWERGATISQELITRVLRYESATVPSSNFESIRVVA